MEPKSPGFSKQGAAPGAGSKLSLIDNFSEKLMFVVFVLVNWVFPLGFSSLYRQFGPCAFRWVGSSGLLFLLRGSFFAGSLRSFERASMFFSTILAKFQKTIRNITNSIRNAKIATSKVYWCHSFSKLTSSAISRGFRWYPGCSLLG